VLGNDADVDGNPLTATMVTSPAHGTLLSSGDGSFTYTPAANYYGTDSFTYRASDGTAQSAVATVTLTIAAVNDAPVAVPDSYVTLQDTPLTVPAPGLLANDSDVEGSALTAATVTNPAHGTATVNANGSFTYTPAAGYVGPDSFTYRVNDGAANSAAVTVMLLVTAVADTTPPVRSNGQPSGTLASGTTSTTVQLTTDEPATCRYALTAGTSYAAMPSTFANTGATDQRTTVSGLTGDTTYTYYIRCIDVAGNANASDFIVTFSVSPAATAGLVAALGFNEGTGTTTADASGAGHTGTLSGPVWMPGRFGSALSFDGINDVVTVNDSAALDLTTAMTLEAWVNPRTGSGWRTVLMKERVGELAYTLYGSSGGNGRPSAEIYTSASLDVRGTASLALNTWTHLAATYDGATLRLYRNGTQVATRAISGAIATSGSPLRIGGNLVWGEYFDGLIDEIRIYNRVLTATEIQTDMNAPVPSAP
jgi:VCBS repeat-containing protein